ncbi:unnamed protein product [Amoebophrya sp. A25]|nr:unnamed protein product [Amoebophrya sp. A25]|eukprot:GSA25T00019953001.1
MAESYMAVDVRAVVDYAQRPSEPVRLQSFVQLASFHVGKDPGDESELVGGRVRLWLYWIDHRVANWPENTPLPSTLWRPECGIMWRLKRVLDDDEIAKKKSSVVVTTAEQKESQEAAAGFQHMPQPQIWNGQDARNRGLVFIKILLELTDIDMLEDEYRLRVFPFDVLRIDCAIWMSGQQRMESTDKLDVDFFPVTPCTGETTGMPSTLNTGNRNAPVAPGSYVETETAALENTTSEKLELYPLLHSTGGAVCSVSNSSGDAAATIAAELDPQKGNRIAVGCRTKAGELELSGITFAGTTHTSMMTGVKYSDVIFSLHLRRRPQLYLWKGVVPLSLCLLYGVLTTLLHPQELGGRLQTHTALFLTVFAIQWVLAERVPKICYLTLLDHLVFAAVAALTILVLGSCVAYGFGLGVAGLLGTTSDGGADDVSSFDLKRARIVDLATLLVVAIAFTAHFTYVARTRSLRSVIWGGGGSTSRGPGGSKVGSITAGLPATGKENNDLTIFGTRSWNAGTHIINGVCVPKPANAFVLEAENFGTKQQKRLGVPGRLLRALEAF